MVLGEIVEKRELWDYWRRLWLAKLSDPELRAIYRCCSLSCLGCCFGEVNI